jgi:hypothetical protein
MARWDMTTAGRVWKREYDRQRRAAKRVARVCYWCSAPAADGVTLCESHRANHAEQSDARAFLRREAGLCITCGVPSAKAFCPPCSKRNGVRWQARREAKRCPICGYAFEDKTKRCPKCAEELR